MYFVYINECFDNQTARDFCPSFVWRIQWTKLEPLLGRLEVGQLRSCNRDYDVMFKGHYIFPMCVLVDSHDTLFSQSLSVVHSVPVSECFRLTAGFRRPQHPWGKQETVSEQRENIGDGWLEILVPIWASAMHGRSR